ncbi:MAG: LLM class flavin-dependent oxidoreductase, partial [Ginsengibacter sp.]
AKHAEDWGYNRFWLAEHHNIPSVASSATSILIGYIAAGTKSIRVGSGGIMLPNHSSLVIAEQFGTLASLFQDRIDLGIGRAPGTDLATAKALRRNALETAHTFPSQIEELKNYFSAENYNKAVRAIPGEGIDIPIWILGSSTDSAYLAARLGFPYAFASHFAPTHLLNALRIYRENFVPSEHCLAPYTMACVNVVAAETEKAAQYIATSFLQLARGIITGNRQTLQRPVDDMGRVWNEAEKAAIENMMKYSFVGNKKVVQSELEKFIAITEIDEIMVVSHVYDQQARLCSFEIVAELFN